MKYFCDRLSTEVVRSLTEVGAGSVTVLEEPVPGGARHESVLRQAGVSVHRPDFFAGHLRTPDGESIYTAARREAGRVALRLSHDVVARSKNLSLVSEREGRGTVALHMARKLQFPIGDLLLRVLAARTLADGEICTVFVAEPEVVSGRDCVEAVSDISVRFHPGRAPGWRATTRAVVREQARRVWAGLSGRLRARPRAEASVLTVQEDDLHTDRSIRGQPHWLDPQAPTPPFDTFVIRKGTGSAGVGDPGLDELRVRVLDLAAVGGARVRHRRHPVTRRLRRDARHCFLEMVRTRDEGQRQVLLWGWRLLQRAEEMAALALELGVRTFVTGEPYQLEPDAMRIAAADVGVRTVGFQYSNLAFASPLMLSTADHFQVFSPIFEPLWDVDGIRPGSFESGGYLYDGVAERVRDRSLALRQQLERHGARYVLCYFDESVQTDRWGLISEDDHAAEFGALAEFVLADPGLGLIVKTQFQENSPSRRYPRDPVLERLRASGRYSELVIGDHRNVVFPVEASLAADLSIGHLIGATAALEAAVAGRRAVLINNYGTTTLHDDLYDRCSLLFSSLDDVLAAVRDEREGTEGAGDLGDWSGIIDRFDPFRDGRAPDRLRDLLTRLTLGDRPAAPPTP
ncbi:MAG: hypothetical protein RJQ04_19650 [Longimicrobiales bacterium]